MLLLYCFNVIRTKLLPVSQGYTFQVRVFFSNICMVSSIVEFQVLSAVTVMVSVCWDVTLVVLYRYINLFTGTCCLHFLACRVLFLQYCLT
jgi:hypothetical protein